MTTSRAGAMAIEVVPTGFALGAEIRGIDARKPVPAEAAEALREAWKQHLVLLFRGPGMPGRRGADRLHAGLRAAAGSAEQRGDLLASAHLRTCPRK